MKFTRALAFTLGILLFCIWVACVVGFRWGMELFADFKIQMPALTLWAIAVTKSFWVWPVTTFVALSSILLALRIKAGWWLALAVCLLCNSVVAGYALTIVVFFNGIAGGDDGSSAQFPFRFSGIGAGIVILVASFALIQVVLGALLFARRWVNSETIR